MVLDDHMQGLRIGLGDLTQEKRMGVSVYGRSEEQFGGVVAVHPHRLVKVAPLVFGGLGRVNTHAALAPDATDHREETVTVLVGHPHPHSALIDAHHLGQTFGQ